jgi:protein-tyrosine kinase
MSNEANSSIDEKTTKLRRAKQIIEEENVNETANLQVTTPVETPQPEKISSNGHLAQTPQLEKVSSNGHLPETSHIEAAPLSLEVKESKKASKQKTKEASAQKLQLQPRSSKRATEEARMLRIRCKQVCVSTFFQGHSPVRSLGFTSAIHGEGKSFLARLSAEAMAEDTSTPVTLLECNWEHPMLSTAFNLMPGPGLAEWLFEDCSLAAIRRQVSHNFTVIPAGDSKNNTIGLLRAFQQRGALDVLTRPGEVLIIDLPSITTTTYGQLAARLVDSIILVVHMGVTPESLVTEAGNMLKDLPVQGVIFNQVTNRTPRWLRQIL